MLVVNPDRVGKGFHPLESQECFAFLDLKIQIRMRSILRVRGRSPRRGLGRSPIFETNGHQERVGERL